MIPETRAINTAPSVRPHCPFISYYEDENQAVSQNLLGIKYNNIDYYTYPPPHKSDNYIPRVLMLGQNNSYDTNFCNNAYANNGNDFPDAIRRLHAYALWKRASIMNEVFYDSSYPGATTQMIIGGQMYDPQFGGGKLYETYKNNPGDIYNGKYYVMLSPNDTVKKDDVLDLPGLNTAQQALVRQSVILSPWYYGTGKWGAEPGPPYPGNYDTTTFTWYYDHALTYRYFMNKGFRFTPQSALLIPKVPDSASFDPADTGFYASTFDGLRNTMESLMRPEFNGYAVGYSALFFTCAYEDTPSCPSKTCGSCNKCRCGWLNANGYWYNSRTSLYDEPKEFLSIEYMHRFASGAWPPLVEVKTASTPQNPSTIRALCAAIEDGLDSAHSGDTVEVSMETIRSTPKLI